MVHWCRTAGPGLPPKFYPVSNGSTAEEAIDAAIERYNRSTANLQRERVADKAEGVTFLTIADMVHGGLTTTSPSASPPGLLQK